ncbi:MAG TPA: hypothetical protein VHX42_02820 [Candidatus Babeliales bacterium]|jgi:hypothetical protein|nr:hypothetical protein [Candidatus Babeliales bacterium]
MNYNKKVFVFFYIFSVIVLNVFSVHAMELIHPVETKFIEQDWGYKKREINKCCYFTDNDMIEYPYFLPDGDKNQPRHLFSESDLITTYQDIFKDICPIDSLNTKNKRTLYFLLETIQKNKKAKVKKLRIEGRDDHFALQMSERITALPLHVRQTISKKYGANITSNIYYKPTCSDVFLDNGEICKDNCSWTGADVGGVFCYCLLCCPCPFITYQPCRALIAYQCAICLHDTIRNRLQETAEEKDKRYGFENIALLQEMECVIVDAKEKID